MRLLLVLSLLVAVTSSYKFFVYIPLMGHSHVTFLSKIAETLAEAGHDVTVVLPIMEPLLVNKTSFKHVKKIHMIDNDPRVEALIEESRNIMFKQLWTLSPTPTGMLQMANNMSLMMGYSCDKAINEDALIAKLKKEKFDVGISEPFNFCGFGIMEQLGIKTTLGAFSGVNLDVISRHLGEPSAYSYVPTMMSLTDKMGLFKRLGNAFGGAVGYWMFNNIALAEGEFMKKKWGNSFSGHEKLLGDMSFSFVNANPYMDFPRPLLHKTVQIGGITVDQKNPGKLDDKWNKVLSERKKTVFISFGSVAKSKDMPENYKQQILKMCASMPDVTFIWKYEEPSTMADHLPNVHLSPWLPQKALLADDRLALFITHGGLGSTTEVAYLGKPAVFIPLFAEQPRNAAMLQRHGTAVALQKEDLADAETVKSAINKVLHDPTFATNAKKLADMLNNQPIPAKQLMLSHAEFAAKYGPLNILTPVGKDLSFIEYYLLDAAALVITVLALLISIPILICRKYCCFSAKKQKKE